METDSMETTTTTTTDTPTSTTPTFDLSPASSEIVTNSPKSPLPRESMQNLLQAALENFVKRQVATTTGGPPVVRQDFGGQLFGNNLLPREQNKTEQSPWMTLITAPVSMVMAVVRAIMGMGSWVGGVMGRMVGGGGGGNSNLGGGSF